MPSQLQDGIHTLALVQSLLDTDSICDYDAVIIIEQPGVSSIFFVQFASSELSSFMPLISAHSVRKTVSLEELIHRLLHGNTLMFTPTRNSMLSLLLAWYHPAANPNCLDPLLAMCSRHPSTNLRNMSSLSRCQPSRS